MNISGQIQDLESADHFDDHELQDTTEIVEPVKSQETTGTINDDPLVANPFAPQASDADIDEPNNADRIFIDKILKIRGIEDSAKILYENEDGSTEERDFYDLPEEDRINILSQADSSNFNEEELYYINQARENNLSFTDLIKYYQDKAVLEHTQQAPQTYAVENYTDEELYVLDMKAKLGDDVTDEQILQQLEKELEIPEIFKKKVDKLREEYIDLEKAEKESQDQASRDQQATSFKEYTDAVTNTIENIVDIGGVTLEDEDKNDILKFLVEVDANGQTQFQKQMSNPENIFLAAWAILKAEDTFDVLKSFYDEQIKEAKKTTQSKGARTTVAKNTNTPKQPLSIEDLHKFD